MIAGEIRPAYFLMRLPGESRESFDKRREAMVGEVYAQDVSMIPITGIYFLERLPGETREEFEARRKKRHRIKKEKTRELA
jgi:hypothetical protein